MACIRGRVIGAVCAAILAVGAGRVRLAADTTVHIDVAFRADGSCAITGGGDGFRANLTYTAPVAPGGDREFRCTVPSAPKGRPVELTVRLPRGQAPARGEFPRLEWTQAGDEWTGHALLPATPSFVRVPGEGHRAARRARWLDASAFLAMALAVGWTLVYTARAR